MVRILGISAFYHDSAACLIENGNIIAAAQEERFTRKKHDPAFPRNAIEFCLKRTGIGLDSVDYVGFYDKPLLKFERLIETYVQLSPSGLKSYLTAMPVWIKEKLFLKHVLRKELASLHPAKKSPPILFAEHHQSHAASAYYPSPFEEAAVLCLDGVGEWATSSAWVGEKEKLTKLWELRFPHSLGLLYSAFTYYCGFRVNSGEYKLMGLAPYGKPTYKDLILKHLIELKSDGSFRLNMQYFDFATGLRMTSNKFEKLFGRPARPPESSLEQFHMDVAASIQAVTEDVVFQLAQTVKQQTNKKYLCLAGGVALNCVSNGKLLRSGLFEEIWVQPASGDAGGALGVALAIWHDHLGKPRKSSTAVRSESAGFDDQMHGAFLGPDIAQDHTEERLKKSGAVYKVLADEDLFKEVATVLSTGAIVGWVRGRMEFGPRALGNRSIIGDPRFPDMQSKMNLKIKYRESFRPFAPAVLAEKAQEFFDLQHPSPYMLVVSPVAEQKRILEDSPDNRKLFGIELLKKKRSQIPAVTHVDFSARAQTVHRDSNPGFHRLISEFDAITGCPVLINTSFNVRGEPIVCDADDAYRCFMRTEIDYLVVGNCLLDKKQQPQVLKDDSWKTEFVLD